MSLRIATIAAWGLVPLHAEDDRIQPQSMSIGGTGGIYLLAELGELVVEVHKRDRHDGQRSTDLRAILVGPDRRHLDEAIIHGDGHARLTAVVERKGVYVVNVTAAYDRYGERVWWGFRTNCPKYLIETSRGHKDARHQEPIVPAHDGGPFDICFLPREGEIGIDVSAEGAASVIVPTPPHESSRPWRLHLPDGGDTWQLLTTDDLSGPTSPTAAHLEW